MLKSFLFILRTFIFVAAAIWMVQLPGSAVMSWGEYTITVKLGYLLVFLLLLVLTSLAIYRIILGLIALPSKAKEFQSRRKSQTGYRALLQGFVAIAAGDGAQALKLSKKARKSLEGDDGLMLLLEAQAYRLKDNKEACETVLRELIDHADLSYLGIRGMIRFSIEEGKIDRAIELTQRALTSHPGHPEVLRLAYQLQLRDHNWKQAEKALEAAARKKALPTEQIDSDRAALKLAEAEKLMREGFPAESLKYLRLAHKKHPGFVPAALELASYLTENNKAGQAAKIIEKTWKTNPHPELAQMWMDIIPKSKAGDPAKRLRWTERLVAAKPDSAESQILAAKSAMEDQLWGEARSYLSQAERYDHDSRVYHLRAEVEKKAGSSEDEIEHWKEKASEALPGKVWLCKLTGRVYNKWSPVSDPHGSFNSIIWDYPRETCPDMISGQNDITGPELLLM